MAHQTGTVNGVLALMNALETFAESNGWTDRELTTADSLGLSKSSGDDQVEVQFRWVSSNPTRITVHQSVDFDAVGTIPGQHTNDSGNGYVPGTFNETNIALSRNVELRDASMDYWFFEDDANGGDSPYLYVVVNFTGNQYSHFGFGCLEKFNDWTGGAFAYGWRKDDVLGQTAATSAVGFHRESWMLDGLTDGSTSPNDLENYVATLHMEGMVNQVASGKWGVVWARVGSDGNQGTDGDAVAREPIIGGFRGGPTARAFGRQPKDGITYAARRLPHSSVVPRQHAGDARGRASRVDAGRRRHQHQEL